MKVPWRWGEPCEAKDFITPSNIGVIEVAANLKAPTEAETIERVCVWVRDEFTYPLTSKGEPCASGHLQRYQVNCRKWLFDKHVTYMWAYPNEVLMTKRGICIATANLCTSVLRALNLPAWTVLGSVKDAEGRLIGYHAWTETIYNGEPHSIETTVEDKDNILFPTKDTYYDRKEHKLTAWQEARNLVYWPEYKYNECDEEETGSLGAITLELIGLPISEIDKLGLTRVKAMAGICPEMVTVPCRPNPRKVEKLWRKEQLIAKAFIREAYHV